MTVENFKTYLENYPYDVTVYAYCDDGAIHIWDYVKCR